MQLTVELNDEKLKQAVMGGIEKLSEEAITELAKAAISEYLTKPDVIWDLIFKKPTNFGSYRAMETRTEPADWFINMISNTFSSEEIEEYRQQIFKTLEEKREGLIVNALAKAFSQTLMTFDMQEAIYDYMAKRNG